MPGPVLVGAALDDRDAAPVALGRLLARLTGRPLALAHAYPYEPLTVPLPEYERELRIDTLSRLERLAGPLERELDVTVHAYARLSPAYGLQELAERLGAEAIVVGSSDRGPIGRVLLGTVGTRLLHGAPCPVAVAPAGYAGPAGPALRIGVAFDGGPESREALEAAVALAADGRATVSAFTVEEPLHVAPSPTTVGRTGLREHAAARHGHAEQVVAMARERIPGDRRGAAELLTGHPAEILSAVSADLDLLVCGSRGYGPMRAVLLGGVSSALARRSRCPLLVLPRGHTGGLVGGAYRAAVADRSHA